MKIYIKKMASLLLAIFYSIIKQRLIASVLLFRTPPVGISALFASVGSQPQLSYGGLDMLQKRQVYHLPFLFAHFYFFRLWVFRLCSPQSAHSLNYPTAALNGLHNKTEAHHLCFVILHTFT